MRNRLFAAAALALLAPTAAFAASATNSGSASAVRPVGITALTRGAFDPECEYGRGRDCRRDDRYGDHRERDRYERERYDRARAERHDRDRYENDRYERARWERERYLRERYARERFARERYERERELARYRHRDRRYSRYDRYPVACVQAGGRVIGSAVLTICIP